MKQTEERRIELADFWVSRMGIDELRGEMRMTIRDEYVKDDYVFQDDWNNMHDLIDQERESNE